MADLAKRLAKAWAGLPPTVVMEVCGTHTHSVARHGLRQLLPENLRLVSGPGCPVCVTADEDIRLALRLARQPGTAVFSFGDMLRVPVPGANGEADSLLRARELGSDVRIALSPMDALSYAKDHPEKRVVWFGVGFETTAPHTAATVLRARATGLDNFFVLSAHKTMPAALIALLSGTNAVGALLCPGHVAVITGANAFGFVPERLGLPGVIAGFEPGEIVSALEAAARLRQAGRPGLANLYPSAVTDEGNRTAQSLMREVFVPSPARWRGLGTIDGSGLALREEFAAFDAAKRLDLPSEPAAEGPPGACRCAHVLRGAADPRACPLFAKTCTPDRPVGPCMVSGEGACSAEYLYGESFADNFFTRSL